MSSVGHTCLSDDTQSVNMAQYDDRATDDSDDYGVTQRMAVVVSLPDLVLPDHVELRQLGEAGGVS